MSSSVEVQTLRYRATFRDTGSFTLDAFGSQFSSLESLIYTAGIIEAVGPLAKEAMAADQPLRAMRMIRDLEGDWNQTRRAIHVTRVSYNSPPEVYFGIASAISVGGGAMYLAASRAIALYDRYLDARIKHQELRKLKTKAELEEFKTAKFIADELGIESIGSLGRRKKAGSSIHSRPQMRTIESQIRGRLVRGGKALNQIESIKQID